MPIIVRLINKGIYAAIRRYYLPSIIDKQALLGNVSKKKRYYS